MKINKAYFPFFIFSAIALGVVIGGKLVVRTSSADTASSVSLVKLSRLIDFIDNEYVDDVNTDSIVDITVNGILEKLDPHSVYLDKKVFDAESQSMKGNFVGIGINFYMYKDTLAVVMPVYGGPSDKAGIKAGDRILYADGYKLFGEKLATDSIYAKLKGKENTRVQLKIFRRSTNKLLTFYLNRGVVPLKSIDAVLLLDAKTGYIKINRFAETTYDEFKSGLRSLKEKGIADLVIDLRDNGGGYMEKAVEIADDLLQNKRLIVVTKNKKKFEDNIYATDNGLFETGKVYVLINENSASASEILAGAIQDNDRGVVIGRRSFGKGLVQKEMKLGDGSAVRLTVARYYTPSGRSIQKPYEEGVSAYFNDFEKRFQSGELYAKDSIKVADSVKYKTMSGRIVYGGGGIVPDVFVPLEGKHGDESLVLLLQNTGVTGYFVFEQLDKHRKDFEGITYPDFIEKMKKEEAFFSDFESYFASSGLTIKLKGYKDLVQKHLKAEFARQLFGEKTYYQILVKDDAMVKKALEINNN